MSISHLYTCTRCKKEFEFEKIKYDDKKKLVCIDCLHQEYIVKKKAAKLNPENPQDKEPINFICVSCRFKFRIKKGSEQAIKCPYCGKTRLMLVKKYKDENDLIRESTNPRFNY